MITNDRCCTIVPYFKIPIGNLESFKKLCEQFVTKTREEPKCLYYGFSFNGVPSMTFVDEETVEMRTKNESGTKYRVQAKGLRAAADA